MPFVSAAVFAAPRESTCIPSTSFVTRIYIEMQQPAFLSFSLSISYAIVKFAAIRNELRASGYQRIVSLPCKGVAAAEVFDGASKRKARQKGVAADREETFLRAGRAWPGGLIK